MEKISRKSQAAQGASVNKLVVLAMYSKVDSNRVNIVLAKCTKTKYGEVIPVSLNRFNWWTNSSSLRVGDAVNEDDFIIIEGTEYPLKSGGESIEIMSKDMAITQGLIENQDEQGPDPEEGSVNRELTPAEKRAITLAANKAARVAIKED